jgi:hypothetical protein
MLLRICVVVRIVVRIMFNNFFNNIKGFKLLKMLLNTSWTTFSTTNVVENLNNIHVVEIQNFKLGVVWSDEHNTAGNWQRELYTYCILYILQHKVEGSTLSLNERGWRDKGGRQTNKAYETPSEVIGSSIFRRVLRQESVMIGGRDGDRGIRCSFSEWVWWHVNIITGGIFIFYVNSYPRNPKKGVSHVRTS